MARPSRRDEMMDTLKPTALAKDELPKTGYTRAVGVALKESEIQLLDQMRAEYPGVSRGALMRYAIRWWLKEHRAGRAPLEVESAKSNKLRMP